MFGVGDSRGLDGQRLFWFGTKQSPYGLARRDFLFPVYDAFRRIEYHRSFRLGASHSELADASKDRRACNDGRCLYSDGRDNVLFRGKPLAHIFA